MKNKDLTTGIETDGALIRTQKALHTPVFFTDLIGLGLGISWGKKTKEESRYVLAMRAIYTFTASVATDVLSSPHPVTNGETLAFVSTGTLPSPLNTFTYYTVTNSTGTTFKLSGVDILSVGSGTHYFST